MIVREFRGMTLSIDSFGAIRGGSRTEGQLRLWIDDAKCDWFDVIDQNQIVGRFVKTSGHLTLFWFRLIGPGQWEALEAQAKVVAVKHEPVETAADDERGDAADLELPPELGGEGGA